MSMRANIQREESHLRVVRDGANAVLPPTDLPAEEAVISAVILDATALPKIVDFLRPEHFFSEANRQIYSAVIGLFAEKSPIDVVTVATWLRERQRIAQVGGVPGIASILDATPAPANVRAHAVAVHDCARRRTIQVTCQRLAISACGAVPDVQRFADDATKALARIGGDNPVRPVESNEQAFARIMAEAEGTLDGPASGASAPLTGVPIGLPSLDRLLGGLRRKAKTTIAAMTGVGKTAFALQAAVHIAKQGVGVLFFSTELERAELLRRAVASESGVSAARMRERRLTPKDLASMRAAIERLNGLPLTINDTARVTVEEIAAVTKSEAERMLMLDRVPLGMIVVDYVQRIEPSAHTRQKERHHQVGHVSRSLKLLAQELNIIVLELAQGRADKKQGRKGKPTADNGIADTTQIAKESDDVVFLLDEGALSNDERDDRRGIEAWVPKNRAGKKNVGVSMLYHGERYLFVDPNAPGANASTSRQYVDQGPSGEDD